MKTTVKLLALLFIIITLSCQKDEVTAPTSTTPPTTTPPVATKSSAKDITKFSFAALSPAVDATIDATAKSISSTLAATSDLTKLTPTITLSDKATVSPASGTVQDFSKEVSYTVTAEDGSTQVYKVSLKKEVVVNNNLSDLYFAKNIFSPIILTAYDVSTGKIAWEFAPSTEKIDGNSNPYISSEGIVYITSGNKTLYAIDAKNKSKLWEFPMPNNYRKPVVSGGTLFIDSGTTIFALDSKTGVKKWSSTIKASPGATIITNGILLCSNANSLKAFDVNTGTVKWESTHYVDAAKMTIADNLIVLKNRDLGISAFDISTGKLVWELNLGTSVYEGLAFLNNTIFASIGIGSSNIVAIDAKAGTKKWVKKVGDFNNISNSPIALGSSLFYSVMVNDKTFESKIIKLNASDGEITWTLPNITNVGDQPIIVDKDLYWQYSNKINIINSEFNTTNAKNSYSSSFQPIYWIAGKAYNW